MFSTTVRRTVLATVFAATLLVPAAQADDWARDSQMALYPAIAAVIQGRTTPEPVAPDPAIAAAIRDRATPQPVALDPAIQTALRERASSPARPDDRTGMLGVGSLPQPEPATTSDAFDWSAVGIGVGGTFAAGLLALGSLLALRHGRARVGNA